MSLVSNFIINPVLRQARRFSSGFATDDQEPTSLRNARIRSASESTPAADDAISEDTLDDSGRTEGSSNSYGPASITPEGRRQSRLAFNARGTARRSALNRPATADSAPAGLTSSPRQLLQPAPSTPTPAEAGSSTPAWMLEANRSTPLPEDDGNGELRRRIIAIQKTDISSNEKARLVHELLMEGYVSRNGLPPTSPPLNPESPTSRSAPEPDPAESSRPLNPLKFWNSLGDPSGPLDLPLTEDDLAPTYVPNAPPSDDIVDYLGNIILADDDDQPKLGCEHYRRNVKMQCATCERWYTCRFCHDASEDHVLPRKETKHMLCMLCGCPQKASDTCVGCGNSAAHYFCGVCKLWNDDPNKPIYHCNDCGLCRVGQGLGRDFFHCKKCMACLSISLAGGHKCIERSVDCDCPICGDYLFNSPKSVVFMQCGHSIHKTCFYEHMQTSYKCPLCSKSCVNMDAQFRNYDMAILSQPMPPEYLDARAIISCNDCSAKSQTTYHWLGLKCSLCASYNTIQHQLLNMPGQEPSPSDRSATGRSGPVGPILPPPASVEELGLPDLTQIRREMRHAARESERNNRAPSPSVFARWFRSVSPAPELASTSASTSNLHPPESTIPGQLPPSAASTWEAPSWFPVAGAHAHSAPAASSLSLHRPSNNPRGPLAGAVDLGSDDDDDDDDDDDLEEDMLDFWGRSGDETRGGAATSGEADEEEESSSEDSSDGGEEEEDEEEEEILLFGHR